MQYPARFRPFYIQYPGIIQPLSSQYPALIQSACVSVKSLAWAPTKQPRGEHELESGALLVQVDATEAAQLKLLLNKLKLNNKVAEA